MTNTEIVLEIICVVLLSSFTSYVGGRVHQWRRQDDERNTAFREGFLRASSTLVTLASNGDGYTSRNKPSGNLRSVDEAGMKRTRIFFGSR